jgi:ABC-type nitrate/sulfonate/bicarbonate transport system substrate-binding protein
MNSKVWIRIQRSASVVTVVSVLSGLSACAVAPSAPPPPNDPVTLRVNVFRGASNIPIYMAVERGAFARRGITPEFQFTPNSDMQRDGLAAGRFDIAVAAVDNAVAMIEVAKKDVVIVAGGDGGMNELMVRSEFKQVTDIRNKNFIVDAPNTAYALIGRKIFKNAGMLDGKDYTLKPLGGTEVRTKSLETAEGHSAMLNPPWSFVAKERGAKSLGSTMDLFGLYQSSGVFVMRPWAEANAGPLQRFLSAYIEGCRATQDPANREQVLQTLQKNLKLERRVAEQTYVSLTTTGHGLFKDCAIEMTGMRNMLSLRAEIEGQWGGVAPAPDKFLDLRYYERALRYVER